MITRHFKKLLFKMALVILPIMSAQGVTITYDLNGGELSNGANSYQADSNNNNNAVLDNPTKTGYIFTGWCDTNDYTAATNTCSNRVGLVTTNNNNASKTMVRWTVPNDLSTDTTFIAMWEQDKFQTTTINISANDYFGFALGASGTFWVDWGDGNVEYINIDGASGIWERIYSHTYINSDVYTVRFGGLATGYSSSSSSDDSEGVIGSGASTIFFGWNNINTTRNSINEGISVSFDYSTNVGKKIAGISGSLGALFPTLSNNTANLSYESLAQVQPNFFNTFRGCTNLIGQIPSGLFSGITGKAVIGMFTQTFAQCSNLGRDGIDDPNTDVVEYVPKYSIPASLFNGISGTPSAWMFLGTFSGCSGLTGQIPATLFSGISGTPAQNMFNSTFSDCSGLTGQIPATLFSGISGTPAYQMFSSTFSGCSGLTGQIPATLFSGISGTPTQYMFASTFNGCSGLTGQIPATLFSGITKPDPNNTAGTTATGQMSYVFSGTGLLTSCPSGMSQYITGFEDYFSGKVSCMQSDRVLCSAGQTLVGTACASCLDPNDCPTAPTQYTCPNGYLANPTHDECITGYTITYYGLEGTNFANDNPNPNAYTAQTPTFTLTNPDNKVEYTFTGWCVYNSAENTGANCANPEMSASITNGSTGNRWAYATWALVCPSTSIPNDLDIKHLGSSWFDLNGNNAQDSGECIDVMYTQEMQTCMMKAMCNNMPAQALQAMLGSNYTAICTQLASVTCDYAGDKVSYMTCRYNANTYGSAGVYTDCSKMVNICNETELLGVLSVLASNQSSAAMFPVELNARTDVDTSDLSAVNWNGYFYQNLMSVVAQIMGGADAGTAISSLDAYNTCSGGSSAFTCESNTWLHVGNEQICTYATKTTDRALAIRVDANHVYYVMLTPASENDYPIHAGSNHKLKIREYNAAGTESTIYNAHDMSVVSE